MEIYQKAKAGQIVPLAQKNSSVTPELNRVIMKTMAADLKERYAQAGDVLVGLGPVRKPDSRLCFRDEDIQKRIQARESRTDHVCWNCRKAMGRRDEEVPLLRRGAVGPGRSLDNRFPETRR